MDPDLDPSSIRGPSHQPLELPPRRDGERAIAGSSVAPEELPPPTPSGWTGALPAAFLESERAAGAQVAFASADWQMQACVRLDSAQSLATRLDELSRLVPGLASTPPVFTVRGDGTIHDLTTGRDAYVRVDARAADLPPRLQEAADRHFAAARTEKRYPGLEEVRRSRAGTEQRSAAPDRTLQPTHLVGFGEVPSYTGEFPSPLPRIMNYTPAKVGDHRNSWYPPSEIRGWLRDAAAYNDVPLELAAAILQQENPVHTPGWRKVGQFAERTLTTAAAEVDEVAFGLVPDKIAGGSSGFANMSRDTLEHAADYVERVLGRKAIPDEVSSRLNGRVKLDDRIPGADWRNDLYFMTAHLRQLIDLTTGQPGYRGPLTREQVERIAAAYNGSGPLARKYGQDTVARIDRAAAGGMPLYFFER